MNRQRALCTPQAKGRRSDGETALDLAVNDPVGLDQAAGIDIGNEQKKDELCPIRRRHTRVVTCHRRLHTPLLFIRILERVCLLEALSSGSGTLTGVGSEFSRRPTKQPRLRATGFFNVGSWSSLRPPNSHLQSDAYSVSRWGSVHLLVVHDEFEHTML